MNDIERSQKHEGGRHLDERKSRRPVISCLIIFVIIGGGLLCFHWRDTGTAFYATKSMPELGNKSAKPLLTITGLKILYKAGPRFDVDITLRNYSQSTQAVVLPPEISIENIPAAITASHPSEFEMMPKQESTYTWSAQVDNSATRGLEKILAEVMSGAKTVMISTRSKDTTGHWHTTRVLGKFHAGSFSTTEAPPSEASLAAAAH